MDEAGRKRYANAMSGIGCYGLSGSAGLVREAARFWWVGVGLVAAVGCGGAEKKEPDFPPRELITEEEEASDPSWDTGEPAPVEEPVEEEEAQPTESEEPKEPEFTPGMSVNEAMSAVPSYYDFVGMDQEYLAKPLIDPAAYKECKVTQNDHFKIRIAVWDGRVVGADVTAPPSKRECIERVVRAITYGEKVKSVNTVEYEF
jgi:hypothetical protein